MSRDRMNTTTPLLDIGELERLQHQTLHHRRTKQRPVAGRWTGAARSLFRGRGMALDDPRAYQPGGDVRHIVDPAEEELPAAGRVRLTAGDGRVHVIDSGDAKLRARYAAAMAERRAAVARVCLSAGASLHRIHTHRDVFEQIEAVL